jgi:hypothetical protein
MDEHVDERMAPHCKYGARPRYGERVANFYGPDERGVQSDAQPLDGTVSCKAEGDQADAAQAPQTLKLRILSSVIATTVHRLSKDYVNTSSPRRVRRLLGVGATRPVTGRGQHFAHGHRTGCGSSLVRQWRQLQGDLRIWQPSFIAMYLVQILLPLFDNAGSAFPPTKYLEVTRVLTERFGGVTAYTRAPAEGRWQDEGGSEQRDEIVILDTMVEALDRAWWRAYRQQLETDFSQDAVVVRAMPIDKL